MAHGDSLLDQVRSLQGEALSILVQAETAGDLRPALAAIREAWGNLELLAKMLGLMNMSHEVDVKTVVNFTIGKGYDDRRNEPEETVVEGEMSKAGGQRWPRSFPR